MKIIVDIKAKPGLPDGEQNANRRWRLQGHIAMNFQEWLDDWLRGIEIEDVTVET